MNSPRKKAYGVPLNFVTSLSLRNLGNYNQRQGGKATMRLSPIWYRLYRVLLVVLVIVAVSGGIAFLVRRTVSPGVEIVIPTATPTVDARAYITGAVRSPGVYTVKQGERLADLVEKAGGALEEADLDRVNLAQSVEDEDHFYIPRRGEELPTATPGGGRININSASVEVLMALPGIGEVKAKAIVDYREQNGPFQTTDELMNVSGIGPATYENIHDLITVGAP